MLKRFFLFLLISTSSIAIVFACAGGYDSDELIHSFFSPEVSRSPYKPFFRTWHALYHSEGNYDNVSLFNEVNVKEWEGYFSGKPANEDLKFLLYEARIGQIDTLIFHLKDRKFPLTGNLKSNGILSSGDDAKARAFLYYLGFAKRCEKYAAYVPEWYLPEEELAAKDPAKQGGMEDLIANAYKALDRQKDAFIRERIVFQIARLHYRKGEYDKGLAFIEKEMSSAKSGNSIAGRIAGYKAAMLFKKKEYAKANLIYAQQFAEKGVLTESAYLSFHPLNEADWNESLNLATDSRDKQSLWCLLGIYHDPVRAMKEIYKLDKQSSYLDLLLTRAVNISEELILPERYGESESQRPEAHIITELHPFVRQVIGDNKNLNLWLWHLADGYLKQLLKDQKGAEESYRKAESLSIGDKMFADQVRCFRIVLMADNARPGEREFDKAMSSELTWLKNTEYEKDIRGESVYQYALKALSNEYKRLGRLELGECFQPNPDDFYASDENIKAMLDLFDKKNKTDLELFAVALYQFEKVDIYNLIATRLFYKGEVDAAIKKFEELPGSGDSRFLADPFVIHIKDCHDCDHADPSQKEYSKLEFLRKIKSLEDEAATNKKKAAQNYFLLGNAYYNSSYYGNARAMYESGMLAFPFVDFEYTKPGLNDPVFDCSRAEEYYLKAANSSGDREFQAKCIFMAAKCEQNKFFNNMTESYEGDFAGMYFNRLLNEYRTTKYYQQILQECGYFKAYVD